MLTEEQIKNLKPGAPLVVQGEFCQAHNNGNILVSLRAKQWENDIHELIFFHPSYVSLPGETVEKPKHDPSRLFKKGDRVRIVKYNGRKFDAAPPTFQLGKVYRVDEDEDTKHCYVMLQSCDLFYAHPVAFLELVTPAEELEPYKLIDSPNTYNIVRDSEMVMTIHKKSHPNAKAAAEAERDRLNAEYRKEMEK